MAGGGAHRRIAVRVYVTIRFGRLCRGSAYHAQMGGWVAHPGNAIRVHAARCAHMAGCLRQRGPTTAGYCAYNANGRDDDRDEESPLPTGHACRSDPGMQALKVC